jgi:drug/metabolite transporter (DMT)-like permease
MRQQRWFPIVTLGLGLFAINAVARVVIRIFFNGDDSGSAQDRVSIAMFGVLGLVLIGYVFVRSQRVAPGQWAPSLAGSVLIGMLLTVLAGPFVSGDTPFADGAGSFFSQIWVYAGVAVVGILLGYWIATMLGRDYRSRSLKAFAAARTGKPHRVVRR